MNTKRTLRMLIIAAAIGSSGAASAIHSVSDIATTALLEMERRAQEHNYQDIEVQIRPLDARLNLAACGQPLRVLPENTRRALGPVSVGVRCDGPQPWTLYVRGQVSASATVPVLAASVGRGELIGKQDVELEVRRITRDIGPIVTEIEDIIGKEARRDLVPGRTLKYADLRAPELIARGDLVTLVSGGGGVKVSMQGKAMAGGAAGDRILVTNLSSGKRIEGVIAADGSVILE
ncbi:MAG: flagellar basal body P-ring formation chaperone FlgA [Halieaceae bacterium]|nr:flagellar basal body P-ring formation chaperone FlgA [Halieaceae bacterium]